MELTLPRSVKEASKQEKCQLVLGSSGKPTTLLSRGASNPITQTSPINLPSLPSSVVEQGCIHSAKSSNCTSDGARTSIQGKNLREFDAETYLVLFNRSIPNRLLFQLFHHHDHIYLPFRCLAVVINHSPLGLICYAPHFLSYHNLKF